MLGEGTSSKHRVLRGGPATPVASGVLQTKGAWDLGVEGLVAVMSLSWQSGVHSAHGEASPVFSC